MTKTYVFFHDGCQDGYAAAWSAWRSLGNSAEYRPVQYGQPIPSVEDGSVVYILDFSYPRQELIDLAGRCARVVVLDHHKTAQQALNGLDGDVPGLSVKFDMVRSGGALAWEHFHPDQAVPVLVRMTEDRDLWLWKQPDSREFSAALSVEPRDFTHWNYLETSFQWREQFESFVSRGSAILAARNAVVESLVNHRIFTEIGGYVVPCLNSPVYQSEIGEALCFKHPECQFAAVWFVPEFGTEVWSLRSRNGFDVSAVARSFGGGGHQAAAGYTKKVTGHD